MKHTTLTFSNRLGMLGLAMAALLACGRDSMDRRSTSHAQDGDLHGNPPDETNKAPPKEDVEVPLYALVSSVGVRNFDQINQSFAKLTGISATTPAVSTQFLAVKADLPSSDDVKAMTPAKISAITKLAAQYCDALVADTTKRSQVFGSFSFTALPNVAFQNPDALSKSTIEAFWGKDLSSLANQSTDIKELSDLIHSMAAGKANTAATTSAVVMGACTATLAAAPVILL